MNRSGKGMVVRMLKVMLVDDEPFILQGLKVLIDWKKEALHAYLWVKTEPKMSLPCTITMFSALLPACSEAAP